MTETKFGQTQTLPRKMPRKTSNNKTSDKRPTNRDPRLRSRSMDLLDSGRETDTRLEDIEGDDDVIYGYIGDAGIDALKRISSEHALDCGGRAKSVTIHPKVTEFHYPGEEKRMTLVNYVTSFIA